MWALSKSRSSLYLPVATKRAGHSRQLEATARKSNMALAQEPTLIMPVSSSRVLLERMDGFLTTCTSQLRTTIRHEQQFHS
jgi:hypothetical protein